MEITGLLRHLKKMSMNNVFTFASLEELSFAAADIIYKNSEEAIKNTGRFTIALSGGKTPSVLFNLLANPPYSEKLDWKNFFIFWGDERFVPLDHDENNSHLAKKLLLDHVPIPTENIFTPQVQMPPAAAAEQYVKMLKVFFKVDLPSFDMILLGMGEDGHTASLFPGTTIKDDHPDLVEAVIKNNDLVKRLTFTPRLINNAKRILVLVSGGNKAQVLSEVLNKKSVRKYPIQMLKNKNLQWLVDSEASSILKK